MLTICAMSDGKGYASKYLEQSDYCAQGKLVFGRWQGRGAELLGLRGAVKSEDFEALRQAREPGTGRFLRQRKSADHFSPDGTTQSRGRHLYDFTIAAPKSVSIMATLGGDTRLVQAHQNAVGEALRVLEAHAATCVRRRGAKNDRTTGNLALAVSHHDASRALDPHLHTHAVAANLTYDGTEGQWKALQASGIYGRRAYLTEVYRNALARQVRRLGYGIEKRHNEKGLDCGFEIRGISRGLLAKYSQRSRQRDEAIERFIAANDRQPTNKEVAVLVRRSRPEKLVEISNEEVRARQLERLDPEEARLLADLQSRSHEATITQDSAEPSLLYAENHIFERVSVCRDHEVLAEALRHGRGQISHEELKAGLTLQELAGTILRDGSAIATAASLKREREITDCINRGIGGFERLGGDGQFIASDRLTPEQKHVVEFVLNSRDMAVNIRGAAGADKTETLQELHRALAEAGRMTLAAAPTVRAVEQLQSAGFAGATTIERILGGQRLQLEMQDKVLMIGEAGMISGRQMWELLRIAERRFTRLVFGGSAHRIQGVEACDGLRILEKESRLKSAPLTQVQRQTAKGYREAIQQMKRNPKRAFEKLNAMGAVREVRLPDRAQAIAQAYTELKTRSQDALVVCPTRDEIDPVTESIRSALKQAGELGKGVQLTGDVSLNWSIAQKSEMHNFRAGQLLGFHRAVKGIAKNETVEVLWAEDKRLIVRNESGQARAITARQARSFDVLDRKGIEVAPADKLLLTGNSRTGFRCTHGEIVTVSHLDSKGGIHLQDGRVLPRNFRKFAYGYAVTAHRSQGMSADTVIISADGMPKESFYVAASWGRKRVLALTSDKQLLRETVARAGARSPAAELARKARPGLRQGICRNLAAARILAIHAAQRLYSRQRRQTLQQTPGNHGISR